MKQPESDQDCPDTSSVKAPSNDLIRRCVLAARERFAGSVVPIYGATERGAPEHIGSGVLLQLPECNVLVTAAHVSDAQAISTLYIGAANFHELPSEFYRSPAPNDDRGQDQFDFAVYEVSEELCAKLVGVNFCKESDLTSSDDCVEGRILTSIGFPISKNKLKPAAGYVVCPKRLTYTDLGKLLDPMPGNAHRDYNTLMGYSPTQALDEEGNLVNAVGYRGCSGGAIVDAGLDPHEFQTGEPDPKLVAIVVEAKPVEKVILGTRLSSILKVFRDKRGQAVPIGSC